jgi:hypothetical protein
MWETKESGLITTREFDPKYLVFVDFDGVLCSNRMQFGVPQDSYIMWSVIDPAVMAFFNKLHDTYEGVYFVWTTTWRNYLVHSMNLEHIAYSLWYNAGFRGHLGSPWRVNPGDTLNHTDRAGEIIHYLDTFAPKVEDYLILDDSDYGFNKRLPKKRFIRTDSDNGMLFRHMKDAWSLTGNWKKK